MGSAGYEKRPPAASEAGRSEAMIELMRTNDQVLLSWAVALLKEGGIMAIVLDGHMSVLEGSIGALPRRLMVVDADAEPARQALREAGFELARG